MLLDPPPVAESARSLYAHVPFCARRCVYCDFAVTVRPEPSVEEWLGALGVEWRLRWEAGDAPLQGPLETVYVGGGTPSLLGPAAMKGLSDLVGADLLSSPGLEWTAEANPESFTDEVAASWREAGVNRVSLGAQSFDARALRWMGRLHDPEAPGIAVERARAAGIDELSVDLIFGLPEGVERAWGEDLAEVVSLGVPHLSLYGLTVGESTPLGRAVALGTERAGDEDEYRREYLEAARFLTERGYLHYEVSNFALPGHESRHNMAYWTSRPYLGMGSSAHSYLHPRRSWNLRDWGAYSSTLGEGRLPLEGEEVLDRRSLRLERIWLGLRTERGLAWRCLPEESRALGHRWVEEGLAHADREALRLTPEGWLLLDELAVELDSSLDGSEGAERGNGAGVTSAG